MESAGRYSGREEW